MLHLSGSSRTEIVDVTSAPMHAADLLSEDEAGVRVLPLIAPRARDVTADVDHQIVGAVLFRMHAEFCLLRQVLTNHNVSAAS